MGFSVIPGSGDINDFSSYPQGYLVKTAINISGSWITVATVSVSPVLIVSKHLLSLGSSLCMYIEPPRCVYAVMFPTSQLNPGLEPHAEVIPCL